MKRQAQKDGKTNPSSVQVSCFVRRGVRSWVGKGEVGRSIERQRKTEETWRNMNEWENEYGVVGRLVRRACELLTFDPSAESERFHLKDVGTRSIPLAPTPSVRNL